VTHLPRSQPQTSSPTVFFIFLLETAQTALTGADVYYWFMAGFGDLEGIIANTRFAPIDLPMIGGIISLIVQLFFCYRIYTLNKRLWWLCTVIAVVSLPPTFPECSFIVLMQKLSFAQASGALWYGIKASLTQLLLRSDI
jgi:hypothetical protein